MKMQSKIQGIFQRVLKEIRGYIESARHKIKGHAIYQSLESKVGKEKMSWITIGGGLLLSLLILTHCTSSGTKHKKDDKAPVPVITAAIQKMDVPVYLRAIGNRYTP